MPDRVPENVPAALVPLAPAPAAPPAFGSWTTLVGARGATSCAACRRRREGFTLIGEHVLGAVDFDRLDAEMDRVDEHHEARFRDVIANTPGGVGRWPCRTTTYHVRDDGRLAFDACTEGAEWHPGDLDGDVVAQRVVRQRWVRSEERDENA